MRFRSVVIRGDGSRGHDSGWASKPMPKIYNPRLQRDHWRQARAAQEKRRQSHVSGEQAGPDFLEPPFPLDVLTDLLFDSPDFFTVVDRLATDVAGMGYDVVDREEVGEPIAVPETGEVERGADRDVRALAQRREAEPFLETVAGDFNEKPLPLEDLFHCVDMDEEATGQGYTEVSRGDDLNVDGLFHVPSRLIRRMLDGEGWIQLDDQQGERKVAIFRDWGSDPNVPESRVSKEEATRYSAMVEGELKNELKCFRHYHPAEAYYGIPPIISALTEVYGNLYAGERNLRFFTHRAMPDWLITIKAEAQTLQDEGLRTIIDKYVANLEEHLKHLINHDDHRTAIVELPSDIVDVVWEKLIPDAKDQDFPQYKLDNRDTIIRVYGVPPHRVGIVETANLGTGSGESQEEMYKRAQVDPRQKPFELFMDEILAERWDLLQFKFRELDILDEQREADILTKAVQTKAVSINEVRRWLSRIVKDQDFSDYDDDLADMPIGILEFQMGGQIVGGGFPTVEPFAPEIPEVEEGLPTVPNTLSMMPAGARFLPRQFASDPEFRNYTRSLRDGQRGRMARMRDRIMGRGGNGHGTAGTNAASPAGSPETAAGPASAPEVGAAR